MTEKLRTALGVLVQKLGEVPQPMDSFQTKFHGLSLIWLPPGSNCQCFISGTS